jgi:hypothetical protein
MGAGSTCTDPFAYASRDSIRWHRVEGRATRDIVAPLPTRLHESPEFDRAHTLVRELAIGSVRLPPGTVLLDPVEAGNLYTEATLADTTMVLGAPLRGTLYFRDRALDHGTLARDAVVDSLPCAAGAVSFSRDHVGSCSLFARANAGNGVACAPGKFARTPDEDERHATLTCTLAAAYRTQHAVFEPGEETAFDPWPLTAASSVSALSTAASHLRVLGHRPIPGARVLSLGARVVVTLAESDEIHVPGDRCAWVTSVEFDGKRAIGHGHTNWTGSSTHEQAEECDRALPSAALSFGV